MSNKQLLDNLKKVLGLTPKYEKMNQRPRVLGGVGLSKMPAKQKEGKSCLKSTDLLSFDDAGKPSAENAQIIEGLFDINTGRQFRVFLDPAAEICPDSKISHFSQNTWYKLQLKNKYRATLKRLANEYDTPISVRTWWPPFDLLTCPLHPKHKILILRAYYGLPTLEDTVYKMLAQNELKAPAFFSTVPLCSGLLEKSPEQYKQAVEEINNYFCGYLNEASHYNDSSWAEVYFRYGDRTEFEISSWDSKAKQIINSTEKREGKKIPRRDGVEQYYKWTCASAPLTYCTVTDLTLDADEAYWGIAPEPRGLYDSRWKCADDLAIGVDLISDYALKSAGLNSMDDVNASNAPQVKFADHFIHCFEKSDGAQQFIGGKDISLYWRDKYDEEGNPTTDKDYQLFTTIKGDGITHLWSLDIYPDKGIIDMKFDPVNAKFIPMHPVSPDLLPTGLNDLSGLNMQDKNGNLYALTLNADGFRLHCALTGKIWDIRHNEYILIDSASNNPA